MKKLKVGVIFGGKSAEHEVSLQSAKNIVEAMDREKYEPILIGIDKSGKWHINNESSYLLNADNPKLIELNKSNDHVALVPGEVNHQLIHAENGSVLDQLDVIFPIVHGTLGEDGSIQGMLRIANLPYVGPDVLGSAICMDKDIAKRLMGDAGINVAKGKAYTNAQRSKIDYDELHKLLGDSMFIKPANQGSSVGVSKVSTKEEFEKAVDSAFEYDHKVIIEETLVGREIEFSVLGNEDPKVSLPGEILPKTDFYSYESKYIDEDGAELAIPAELSKEKVKEMQQVALDAFQTLQCEGLARVDFFLTEDGQIYVNEINTLPGFTKISMYPKLWEISGIGYTDLISQLIELAVERHERHEKLKSSVWDS